MFNYRPHLALILALGLSCVGSKVYATSLPTSMSAHCTSVRSAAFDLSNPDQTISYPEGEPEKAQNAKVNGVRLPWSSCGNSNQIKLTFSENNGKVMAKAEDVDYHAHSTVIVMPAADMKKFVQAIRVADKVTDDNIRYDADMHVRLIKDMTEINELNPDLRKAMESEDGEVVNPTLPSAMRKAIRLIRGQEINGKASGSIYSLRVDGSFEVSALSTGDTLDNSMFSIFSPDHGYNNVALMKLILSNRPDLTLVYVRATCQNTLLPVFSLHNGDCIIWGVVAPTQDIPLFLPKMQEQVGLARKIIVDLDRQEAIEQQKDALKKSENQRLTESARNEATALGK